MAKANTKRQGTVTATPRTFQIVEQPDGQNELFKIPVNPLGAAVRKMAQLRDAKKEVMQFLRTAETTFIKLLKAAEKGKMTIELGGRQRTYRIVAKTASDSIVEE